MRGTRIRWDGALKALGIGAAALVALFVLPGLLAGEPPPPPEDVGLVPPPPPAPAAPAPAPSPPQLAQPNSAQPKPAKPKRAKRKRVKRPRGGRGGLGREDGIVGDRDRNGRVGADPGAPAAGTAPSHPPPAAVKDSFGFER